jgi:hypothetical protein
MEESMGGAILAISHISATRGLDRVAINHHRGTQQPVKCNHWAVAELDTNWIQHSPHPRSYEDID